MLLLYGWKTTNISIPHPTRWFEGLIHKSYDYHFYKQGSINYSFSPWLATISTHKLLYPLPSLPPVFNYNDLHILPLHTITMVGKQKQTINFTEIFLNQLWILCMKLKKILQFQHLCIVTTMSHVRLVWISSIFWVNFN